ncbi:MAG: hypothetical protein HQL06_03175 [Nitrospirae bacterium]|nr:hypothetical protein [Nitrospirota bacterium]
MNKSKEKRVRKELDKLLNSGRYWQWIKEIQEADLKDHYTKEWISVWQDLSKQVLRHPEKLPEFWKDCTKIKSPPEIPDIKLHFYVREFLYEDRLSEELINLVVL